LGPSRALLLAAALAVFGPSRAATGQPTAVRAAAGAAVRAVLPAQDLPRLPSLALPRMVGKERLQALLQAFVDRAYGKAFRHLGEERDFDHGHFLFASDAPDAAPVAILYHTQELAYYEPPRSDYGWLDPEARNWVQWLDDGRIENAKGLQSADAPRGLPVDEAALRSHHTILAQMLRPGLFGGHAPRSRQVVFTKAPCPAAGSDPSLMEVRLPSAERVCLSLSEY
jgi:hypothetical protein